MNDVPVKTRKKLIEVALPLDAINAASAREKSIRHGHPSTLHLWWARRPLAAARAVIFAQMVDDPSSYVDTLLSEAETRRAAERELRKRRELWTKRKVEFESASGKEEVTIPEPGPAPTLEDCAADVERQRLFRIIEELVKWENTTNEVVLQKARDEIWQSWRRACLDNVDHPRAKELFDRHKLPAFHDPFAGGGTLPLEAQRLGLEAYASDLNPVPVLINKAMIEIPPKFAGRPPVNPDARKNKDLFERKWKGAEGLAEDVRYYGKWMRDEAERRIGHLYPKVEITAEMARDRPDLKALIGQKLTVTAWIWVRTVKSPNPAFHDVDVPLASTFVLNGKSGKEAFIEPIVANGSYHLAVRIGGPIGDNSKAGTKLSRGANFRCIMSGSPIEPDYIKAEGVAGRMKARLMALVVEGAGKRTYLSGDTQSVPVPDGTNWTPQGAFVRDARAFTPSLYGLDEWAKLFSDRQMMALTTFADLVSEAGNAVEDHCSRTSDFATSKGEYSKAVRTYLAFAVDRSADYWSTIAVWAGDFIAHTFGRNALPMTWDYAEGNPFSDATGCWMGAIEWIALVMDRFPAMGQSEASMLDAAAQTLSRDKVVSTDPPYYDNVPYADLSDYFYAWLRPMLSDLYPELFATMSAPKDDELVVTSYRHGNRLEAEKWFLEGMTKAMRRLRQCAHAAFPVTIYYAFKQSEGNEDGVSSTGWETFLDAVFLAGFSLVGTWPVRTERPGRLRENKSNALASSIVLVCSPKNPLADTSTRRAFIDALKAELPGALANLQRGNIAPVDLAQAAIGPGMAVYTRFAKVIDAEGKELRVRDALALINEVLDEVLAKQEGDFDADSRWAITWFEDASFDEGDFGRAEQLSKSRNTAIDGLVRAGIIASGRGKVRLLKPNELSPDWDPATDLRLTIWEVVHHLVRVLEAEGESAAAVLLAKIGARGEVARELAYRLYSICERKKRATEALSYNGLVQAWPEISRLARGLATAAPTPTTPAQSSMDV